MIHRLQGKYKTRNVILDGMQIDPNPGGKIVACPGSPRQGGTFDWGYCGPGPAILALAICLKLFGKDRGIKLYQDFKWNVISELPVGVDFDVKFDENTLQLLGASAEEILDDIRSQDPCPEISRKG